MRKEELRGTGGERDPTDVVAHHPLAAARCSAPLKVGKIEPDAHTHRRGRVLEATRYSSAPCTYREQPTPGQRSPESDSALPNLTGAYL